MRTKREEKINKKLAYYDEILERWYDSIMFTPMLDSRTIKKNLRKYYQETDTRKRETIKEDIIMGTLPYVYHFIKKSGLNKMLCSYYDMEDIIQATCEAWINFIMRPEIYMKHNSYSVTTLLRQHLDRFLFQILSNLHGSKINGSKMANSFNLDFSQIDLGNLYLLYLQYIQNEISYAVFCDMAISLGYVPSKEVLMTLEKYLKPIPQKIFIRPDITPEEMHNIIFFLLYVNYLNYPGNPEPIDLEETISDQDYCEYLSSTLSYREQAIIRDKYYYGWTDLALEEKYHVTNQNIGVIKRRALKKMQEVGKRNLDEII